MHHPQTRRHQHGRRSRRPGDAREYLLVPDVAHVASRLHRLFVDGRGDHGGESTGSTEFGGAFHSEHGVGATGGVHGAETKAGRPLDADVDNAQVALEIAGARSLRNIRLGQSGSGRSFGQRPAAADQEQRRGLGRALMQSLRQHFRPNAGRIAHRYAQGRGHALPAHRSGGRAAPRALVGEDAEYPAEVENGQAVERLCCRHCCYPRRWMRARQSIIDLAIGRKAPRQRLCAPRCGNMLGVGAAPVPETWRNR